MSDLPIDLTGATELVESFMVDECEITADAAGPGVWNDATSSYTPGAPTEIYSGPCMFRVGGGDLGFAARIPVVDLDGVALLPLDSPGVDEGQRFRLVSSQLSPHLNDLTLVVVHVGGATYAVGKPLGLQAAERVATAVTPPEEPAP